MSTLGGVVATILCVLLFAWMWRDSVSHKREMRKLRKINDLLDDAISDIKAAHEMPMKVYAVNDYNADCAPAVLGLFLEEENASKYAEKIISGYGYDDNKVGVEEMDIEDAHKQANGDK